MLMFAVKEQSHGAPKRASLGRVVKPLWQRIDGHPVLQMHPDATPWGRVKKGEVSRGRWPWLPETTGTLGLIPFLDRVLHATHLKHMSQGVFDLISNHQPSPQDGETYHQQDTKQHTCRPTHPTLSTEVFSSSCCSNLSTF